MGSFNEKEIMEFLKLKNYDFEYLRAHFWFISPNMDYKPLKRDQSIAKFQKLVQST